MRTATGAERFAALLSVFCTADGAAKANIVTKTHPGQAPRPLRRALPDEQKRVCALLDRRRAVITRTRTGALLTLASDVILRYRAEKEARGLLDYDDLIAKTRDLLSRVSAAWVHYKLDLGIDHLLIDEAQDTSPEQWDIIERLVAEFAAGAGARGTLPRSIFAVGDDKQSIFSFQGADPREFHEKQRSFKRTFEAAEIEWRNVRLDYSFRSNDSVLTAVQHVFQAPAVFRSVTTDEAGISAHLALPDAAPGFVEIWPLVEPEKNANRSSPGIRRSTRPRRRARASSSRGRSPRRCGCGSTARTTSAPAPSAMRCGRATFSCWCASAGRCSRRSSAR